MRPARLAPAFVLVALTALRVHAEPTSGWRLVFRTTTSEERVAHPLVESEGAASTATAGPSETRTETVVRLAPTWLSVQEGASEMVYDFTARRMYSVDRKAASFSEISLFADIGFREHEMKNRRYLAEVLDKAIAQSDGAKAVPEMPTDVLDAECTFGIEAIPPATSELQESTIDGLREFQLNGKPSVRYRAAEGELPEAVRPALRRFLVYGVHVHPRIAERIESVMSPPAFFEYRVRQGTIQQTIRLELTESVEEATDWQARFVGLQRARSENSLPQLEAKAPTLADYRAEAAAALERKSYINAMLALFEAGIALGLHDTEEIQEVREAGKEDAGLAMLLEGLGTKDQQEALKLFDSIDVAQVRRRHVLDVFRANAMAGAGDPAGAIDLFRKTIAGSPHLTGAYFDLGGLLFNMYEVPAAWECWDAARRIAPEHPLLAEVTKLEEHLARTYPGFF